MANNHNDPLFDDEPRGMVARILPPLVLMCAFGGFVALAIYAYKAGSQSVNEGELMVIEADKTPMKEKPQDPGGMQFPNQDKTIFNTIASGSGQPPAVERVLPAPEEPIAKDAAPANWANDKLATATPAKPVGAEQVFGDDDAPPAAAKSAEPAKTAEPNVAETGPKVVNIQEELGKQAVAEPKTVAPETPAKAVELAPKTLEKMAAKVEPIPTEKTVVKVAEKSAVKTEEKSVAKTEEKTVEKLAEKTVEKPVVKAEEKAAAKTAEKPKSATAKGLVQLGAYKSEPEAKADFAKIQKKNSALAGKSPTINRADLGDKGVFFRLRVVTDDAKALCAKLSASGQACMAVK